MKQQNPFKERVNSLISKKLIMTNMQTTTNTPSSNNNNRIRLKEIKDPKWRKKIKTIFKKIAKSTISDFFFEENLDYMKHA